MLPHHHVSQSALPMPLHQPGLESGAMSPSGRRWRRALCWTVLALPLSLPLFIAYELVTLPCLIIASLIM